MINLNDKTNKSIAEIAAKVMQEQPAKIVNPNEIKPIQSDMVNRVMGTGVKGQFIKEAKDPMDTSEDIHADKNATHVVHLSQNPKGSSGWRGSARTLKVHVAATSDEEAKEKATAAAKKYHENDADSKHWEAPFVPSNPMIIAHPVKSLGEPPASARASDERIRFPSKLNPRPRIGSTNKFGHYSEEVEQIDESNVHNTIASLKAEGKHEEAGQAERNFHRGYDRAEINSSVRASRYATNRFDEETCLDEKMQFSGNRRVTMNVYTQKDGKRFKGKHTVVLKKVPLGNTEAITANVKKKAERSIRNHIKTNSPGHTITDIEHLGIEHLKESPNYKTHGSFDRPSNDVFDREKRGFKSREHAAEYESEERAAKRDREPHHIYINGKIWKRDGQPVVFNNKSHARASGLSILKKDPSKDIRLLHHSFHAEHGDTYNFSGMNVKEAWKEDGAHMTSAQKAKREEIAQGMKPVSDWEERYPGRGENVMYATATKMAMKKKQLGEEEMNRIIGEATDLNKIVANWHKMSSRAKEALKSRHGEALTKALGSNAVTTTGGQAKQAQKPSTSSTVTALANKFSGTKEGPKPKTKSLADIRAENIRRTKEAQEKGIAHGNAQSRAGGNAGENPDARDKESDLMKSSHEIAGEMAAAKGGTAGAIVSGSLKPDKTANKRKKGEDEENLDEGLKGNQNRIDVARPYGKLTAADFKRLRAMRKGR